MTAITDPAAPPAPGLYPEMSWDAYRALPCFNQSTLKVWVEKGLRDRCPAKFKYWLENHRDEPSEAMKLGSVIDSLMLEEKEFHLRFVIVPETAPARPNSRQIEAKSPSRETVLAIEWWEEFTAFANGRTIVTARMFAEARAMADSLRADPEIHAIFQHCKKMVAVAELQGLPCKAQFDLFSESADFLFDLKASVSAANHESGFGKILASFDYAVQTAFYLDIAGALGFYFKGMCFVVVESEAPHFHNVITLLSDDPRVESARRRYRNALLTLAHHTTTNHWPSYQPFEEAITPRWHVRESEAE